MNTANDATVTVLREALELMTHERDAWRRCAEARGALPAAHAQAAVDRELERLQQCLSGARSCTSHVGVRSLLARLISFIGDRRVALREVAQAA